MIECMNPLYLTHRLNDSKGNVGMTLSFFLTILVSLGGELMKYFRLVHSTSVSRYDFILSNEKC